MKKKMTYSFIFWLLCSALHAQWSLDYELDSHRDPVELFSTSSQNILISVSEDISWNKSEVKVWDLGSGKLIRSFDDIRSSMSRVLVSEKGSYMALVTSSRSRQQLWANHGAYEIYSIDLRKETVLKFTQDEKYLLTTDDGKAVNVWSLPDGERKHRLSFSGLYHSLILAELSPDGKKLFTGHLDRRREKENYRVWDLETGNIILTIAEDSFYAAQYKMAQPLVSKDFKYFSLAEEGGRGIWSLETGERVCSDRERGLSHAAALSPDGKMMLGKYYNGKVSIWNTSSCKVIRTMEGGYFRGYLNNYARFTPDGKRVIAVAWDKIFIWEASTGKLLYSSTYKDRVKPGGDDYQMSNDGKYFARKSGYQGDGGFGQVWDIENARELSFLKSYEKQVTSLTFSEDSQRMIIGLENGKTSVWKLK